MPNNLTSIDTPLRTREPRAKALQWDREIALGAAPRSRRVGVLLLAFVLALAIILPLMPGAMRETDQASVIRGGLQIARTASLRGHSFYHYDKMFGSYAALGLLYRALPAVNPVSAANVLQFVLWLIASAVLFIEARRRSATAQLLLAATLLSPVWILHVPFFSPAAISAYVLTVAFFAPRRGWLATALTFVLAFIATAMRADAAIALPFVAWATTPRSSLPRFAMRTRTLALAAGAVAALVVGPLLMSGTSEFGTPLKIIPKVVAAFLVFALGVGTIVFAMVASGLGRAVFHRRPLFYFAGSVFFLAPFGYYIGQLLSPRYLMLTVTITACALATRRVALLASPRLRGRAVGAVLVICALVPLVIGLSLPTLRSPRLTLTRATAYPTADGHWPMGAVIGFAWTARTADGIRIDHNQPLFEAALRTKYHPTCGGQVAVLYTPMLSYLDLAVYQQGLAMKRVDDIGDAGCNVVYADLRSLTHEWTHAFEKDGSPRHLPPMTIVSGGEQPIVIAGEEQSPLLREELVSMREAFGGREFELLPLTGNSFVTDFAVQYVLASPQEFQATTTCGSARAAIPVTSTPDGIFRASVTPAQRGCSLAVTNENVLVARSVLPPYMKLN